MMKKRGQGGEAVKYLLIAAVVIFVTFFGYSAVQKAMDKVCNAEIAKFEIGLKGMDKAAKYGSVKEFTEQVPCNADKIYFFDLDKGVNPDFIGNRLIRDSLQSKAQQNVFLAKGDKIISSFYAGNLSLEYPNYLCLLPKSGKISFFAEGKGNRAGVFSGCFQPECTYIPVEADEPEAVGILNEAVGFGSDPACINCPADVADEFHDFLETRQNVDIFRKYEYCKEEGKTNVEIIIKRKGDARLRNFRFYESIPKECMEDLNTYLSSAIEGEVSIKHDPLIIWSFIDLKEEQKLNYILDAALTEDCRETINGLGISNLIEEGVSVDAPTEAEIESIIERDTNLQLSIGDIILPIQNPKQEINLQQKTTYNGAKEYLRYSIIGPSTDGVIECSLHASNNKQLSCEASAYQEKPFALTVQATGGKYTAVDTVDVRIGEIIKPTDVCGDNVCNTEAGESCSTCRNDCGSCPIASAIEYANLACRQTDEQCDWPLIEPCDGYEKKEKTGKCVFFADKYLCYNEWASNGCQKAPSCPDGFVQANKAVCTCDNTDTNCGKYPDCQNCNSLDAPIGESYCAGNDAYGSFNDYKCVSNTCQPSAVQQLRETCPGNQQCQAGSCISAYQDGGGDSGGGSCFPAGTKIAMSDGSLKNIEDIKVGELILSYDLELNEQKAAEVLDLESPIREGYYVLNGGLLRVTDEHPIYIKKQEGSIGWGSLNPEKTKEDGWEKGILKVELGDKIKNIDNTWVKLESIQYVEGSIKTYNLKSVSMYNTFYADGVLVHNKGG